MDIEAVGPYRILQVKDGNARYLVVPGQSLDGLPQEVQDAAAEQHIPSVVASYQASLPPAPTLADLKERRKAEINAERDRRETEGFEYGGVMYDSDVRSAQRISVASVAALAALSASQPFSVDWTAADNSVVTLDAQGVVGLNAAFATHGMTLHETAKTLKASVDAATTVAEVEGVVWP